MILTKQFSDNVVNFDTLADFDCFLYKDKLYMKLPYFEIDDDERINAIRIEEAAYTHLDYFTVVRKLNTELVLSN